MDYERILTSIVVVSSLPSDNLLPQVFPFKLLQTPADISQPQKSGRGCFYE